MGYLRSGNSSSPWKGLSTLLEKRKTRTSSYVFTSHSICYILLIDVPPHIAAKPAPTPKPAPPSAIPATPLVRASVLKPQKQSPLRSALDSLASDGAVASAVEATAVIGATHIPELFKSVSGGPDKSKATAVIPTQPTKKQNSPLAAIANAKKSLESAWVEVGKRTPKVVNDVGAQVRDWWKRERLSKVVESCLPNRKLDALAIDSMLFLLPFHATSTSG